MQHILSQGRECSIFSVRADNTAYSLSGERMQHILCQGRECSIYSVRVENAAYILSGGENAAYTLSGERINYVLNLSIYRKLNVFYVEYGICFTCETGFFKIFTCTSHPWKCKNIHSHSWNEFHIQRQIIENPLYIHSVKEREYSI